MIALTVFPLLSEILDRLVGRTVHVFGWTYPLPGVRLALYLGAFIVIVAGVLASLDVHRARKAAEAVGRHPAAGSEVP